MPSLSIKLFIRRSTIILVSAITMTSTLFPVSAAALEEANSSPPPTETTQTASEETSPDPPPSTSTETPPSSTTTEPNESKNETTPTSSEENLPNTTTAEQDSTTPPADTTSSIGTTVTAPASSGDVTATDNGKISSIATGATDSSATVINVIQSSTNLSGGAPILFVYDIDGDVSGDFVIDPSSLQSTNAKSPIHSSTGVPLTTSTSSTINNTIDLSAVSGGATVQDNRVVGDVQTGSAKAVANVINLINSAINANQSFVGMVNIHGNFDGDILIPASFVHNILAANPALPAVSDPANGVTLVSATDTTTITNSITAAATSGTVTAKDNRRVGDITTGNATTNVTIMNLTGKSVVGSNALLVFVNVLGSWVGLIFDAPAGTTSATLGGGTTTAALPSSSITSTNTMAITNTISVLAQSGDITAEGNRRVGDMATGNAQAGVNLLNIVNSQLSFTDWFGVLFINVFGNWRGDLAVQPTPQTTPTVPGKGGGTAPPRTKPASTQERAVFSFVPALASLGSALNVDPMEPKISTAAATITADNVKDANTVTVLQDTPASSDDSETELLWLWTAVAVLGTAGLLATGRYIIIRRHTP